jgi:co-chaperonin GroES (HSP10)
MKYEPKFGRVLIEREVKKETKGGIVLPDSVAQRHANCIGTIVALGETAGWCEIPEKGNVLTLKVGQKVVFGQYSGSWLDQKYGSDDGTLYICQDADILAVINEENAA